MQRTNASELSESDCIRTYVAGALCHGHFVYGDVAVELVPAHCPERHVTSLAPAHIHLRLAPFAGALQRRRRLCDGQKQSKWPLFIRTGGTNVS